MKQQLIGFIAIILITLPADVFGETAAATSGTNSTATSRTTPPPYTGCCVKFDESVGLAIDVGYYCLKTGSYPNYQQAMTAYMTCVEGIFGTGANLNCCYNKFSIDFYGCCTSYCENSFWSCLYCVDNLLTDAMNTLYSCAQYQNSATGCGGSTCGTKYTCVNT